MNLDKLNKWLTLFANIGVLAGIVFLSIEISQNNLLLESEARMNQGENVKEGYSDIFLNYELASLLAKVKRGEALDETAKIQLDAYQKFQLLEMQFQYEQFRSGALDQINLPAWKTIFNGYTISPPLIDAWEMNKHTMRPDFMEFFEENIVNK